MKKVQLTETVLRDANQSLMATRLPYSDYEGILSDMDGAEQHLTPVFVISVKTRGRDFAI